MSGRPFLFLGVRAEDDAADDEYAAMLRSAGLEGDRLHRVRLEQGPLGDVDLTAYAGIILGGGPFCVSDPEETKSDVQRRVEADLDALLVEVIATDTPFMGCCYGIGTLGRHLGAVVDRTCGEPVGGVRIRLTDAGRADPVMGPAGDFVAFVGHKEGIADLPPGAVLLATSQSAPVQAFRVGRHVYATQFHPELDVVGLELRMRTYRDHGYFAPDELEPLVARARTAGVAGLPPLLRRFVAAHGGAGPATT